MLDTTHGPDPALGLDLCRWHQKTARDLPWRRTRDPYAILVSEIMLQQTQVDAVIPYYLRWMERFPTVQALADASVDEVLRFWAGLGYYNRARNLHKAAQKLAADFNGAVPPEHGALLSLPGIGPYTAGAVLSIAFDQDHPVVDGNVKRVFARILDMDGPVEAAASLKRIQQTALDLLPSGEARIYNQALMELGALVCTPKNPNCQGCPVSRHCLARSRGTVDSRPVQGPRQKTTALEVAAGVLVHRGRILVQKRLPGGLMGGLWEFPGGKLKSRESPEQALVREFAEELELDIVCGEKITVIKHAYTRFRVTLHTFWCTLKKADQTPRLHAADEFRWVSARELEALAFPAADKRLIEILKKTSIRPPEGAAGE